MLHYWLYPLLDWVLFPLFWFPPLWGLTLASVLFGIGLLALYAVSSDQWAMAHYKQKVKRAQRKLMEGDYSWSVLKSLGWNNMIMARYGFIPAVVCIGAILLIIPWLGNRFGHRPPGVNEPIAVTIEAEAPWQLETNPFLRVNTGHRTFQPGETRLRLLAEQKGTHLLVIKTKRDSILVPIHFGRTKPLWPTITRPRWYHTIVNPAELNLPSGSPVSRLNIGYRDVIPSLAFSFPGGGPVPGWLSWFFLVGFGSGLWAKWNWEIE